MLESVTESDAVPREWRETPVTVVGVGVFWATFLVQTLITRYYGYEAMAAVFVVQYDHLLRAWTWVTATFGHVNLLHVAINTAFLATLGRWAERSVGPRHYVGAFLGGGVVSAVGGTLLGGAVSGHLLVDLGLVAGPGGSALEAGVGSSMGLLAVFGLMMAVHPRGTTAFFGLRTRRWIAFLVVLAVSVAGTVSNYAVLAVPIGHPYHLVGMLAGAVYGRVLVRTGRCAPDRAAPRDRPAAGDSPGGRTGRNRR